MTASFRSQPPRSAARFSARLRAQHESGSPATVYPCYPQRFARFLFRAMAVEMGDSGLKAVLTLAYAPLPDYQAYIEQMPPNTLERAFIFPAVAAINSALDAHYGHRPGRGMALRIGRAWFYQGMQHFGALEGIATPAVAALPPEMRTRLALSALAHIFSSFSDQTAWLDESDRVFRFVVDPCATAYGLRAERPICQTMVGLLQECVRWASGAPDVIVRETHCRAVEGGACIFTINKHFPSSADKTISEGRQNG